jgi:hypothetical protein
MREFLDTTWMKEGRRRTWLLQSPRGNLWGERVLSSWIDPVPGNCTLTLDQQRGKFQLQLQLKLQTMKEREVGKGEVGWI